MDEIGRLEIKDDPSRARPASPPTYVPPSGIPQPAPAPQHSSRKGQSAVWDKAIALASVFTNLGVFVFGAIGTIVIFFQLAAMQNSNAETERANRENLELARESLAESRQALQLTQRARLAFPGHSEFDIDTIDKARWIQIKNTGLTPANKMNSVLFETIRGEPLSSDIAAESWPKASTRTDVAAGQTMTTTFEARSLTDDEVEGLKAKKLFIYLGTRYVRGCVWKCARVAFLCDAHRSAVALGPVLLR